MCTWCSQGGYWECDGEGGDCRGGDDDGGGGCSTPGGGGWEIDCKRPLRYRDGSVINGVEVRITGKCDAGGENLSVEIDGQKVSENGNGGPQPPNYGDGRPRQWRYNQVVTVGSQPPIPVRVQAYAYVWPRSSDAVGEVRPVQNPDVKTGATHPSGWGPKLRVIGPQRPTKEDDA